jgi:hypothetical protein
METPRLRAVSLFLALLASVLLLGCAGERYKVDYSGFQGAYAENSNRQLLLNLARLDWHEPTYFLQFGQISVSYNWNSSLSASAADSSLPGVRPPAVVSGSANLSGSAGESPQFTFIPVTDEKVAQLLLQPVDPEILYTLFLQGMPVDQLMRLMIERIEVPSATGNTVYFNSPGAPNYVAFLKTCAVARELQKDGHLILEVNKVFTPAVEGVEQAKPPTVDQVIALDKTQLTWGHEAGHTGWTVGSYDLEPVFKLDGGYEETFTRLDENPVYRGQTLNNMKIILSQKGFTLKAKPLTNDDANLTPHLVMRSFLSILTAASQEQARYNKFLVSHPAEFARVPEPEREPILQLRWDAKTKVVSPPVVDLDYHGQYYQVTDPATGNISELASWNRDVFRLLVQLSSQVSIDISKYPLPTTLQVAP